MNQRDDELLELDVDIGAGEPITEVGPMDDMWVLGGMDFDAELGTLFVVELIARRLLRIDPRSGEVTTVGNMGTEYATAVACDEGAGVLYVVACAAGIGESRCYLYRVARFTADATYVGEIGFTGVSGLAFDRTTGVLYGACGFMSGSGGRLIRIDVDTGAASHVGSTVLLDDIAFDEEGQLYGVLCGRPCGFSILYKLNKATATATVVGLPGHPCVCSIAFAYLDDTPVEPRSWTMIKAMYRSGD